MEKEHPIGNLMMTAMTSLESMVDVNTIVGDIVTSPDGTVIIPVSKVCFGFAAGGSELNTDELNNRKFKNAFWWWRRSCSKYMSNGFFDS